MITSRPALRVDDQDWSELTLEAFPEVETDGTTHRVLHAQGMSGGQTGIVMETTSDSRKVTFGISAASDGAERAWVIRLHLRPDETVSSAIIDGQTVDVVTIAPTLVEEGHGFFPFQGRGSAPAPHAGPIAELHVAAASSPRQIVVWL